MSQHTHTSLATGQPYVLIHTDGSCLGNPGRGGFAAILQRIGPAGEVERTLWISGGEPETTNNRMELMAAIRGLEALKRDELPVVIVTDSQYVRKGITEWIANWKANGWRTSARKPVANDDLWQALDAIAATQRIEWRWTKAHKGNATNEEADHLARTAAIAQRSAA